MRGRVLVIVFVGAVIIGGGAGLVLLMRPPAAPAASGSTPAAATTPAPAPPPAAEPPTPPPSSTKTGTVKPKAEKPKAIATEPPAPAPVAAPVTGTLRVTADVGDASVFIDRKFIGTAPVTAADIPPGSHHLNVSAPGYDAVSQDIDVAVGSRDIAIAFKEIRLAASVAVVHKHGMGSCKGTLRASPQGLVYETTDKGDAFSVSLADIETFEVDYLNKNLKLKVKKGRTYNFTDPDGNADRLFVFHRDVEKARKRVEK